MRYIIDSYARLEYFTGTDAGKKAKEIIDSVVYEKLTPTINKFLKFGDIDDYDLVCLGSLARLGHHLGKVGVAGSNPARGSIYSGLKP